MPTGRVCSAQETWRMGVESTAVRLLSITDSEIKKRALQTPPNAIKSIYYLSSVSCCWNLSSTIAVFGYFINISVKSLEQYLVQK